MLDVVLKYSLSDADTQIAFAAQAVPDSGVGDSREQVWMNRLPFTGPKGRPGSWGKPQALL